MYQALYRVWRPKSFQDMVGQESIRKTLRNQVKSGRIAHAYLFCGSRGTGKTSAAKIMARAINCQTPVDGDPCGECESCKMLLSDSSFDVYEMDAASNSRVEEIRELLEKVDYPPQFGKYKVYIIDEVHMLSNAAFNALLKTLEEPPHYMVFILATTEPQKLPSTILSRCQRFDFGRLTEAQIVSRLKEAIEKDGIKCEEDALYLIAQAAEGGMRDAWSILDMCMGTGDTVTADTVRAALGAADKTMLFDVADAIQASDGAQALRLMDRLMREGRDVQVFLKDFSAHLRKLMVCKLCGADQELLSASSDGAERLKKQSEQFTSEKLLRVLNLVMKAEADTRWAASARSVLEVCMLKCCEKADVSDISGLLERLSELEMRLQKIESGQVKVSVQHAGAQETKADAPKTPKKPAAPKQGAAAWNEALKILKNAAPAVFGPVSMGTFDGCDDHLYRLLFPKDQSLFVNMLSSPERRETVEKALKEAGDESARFEVKIMQEVVDTNKVDMANRNAQTLIDAFGRDKVQIEE